MDVLQYEKVINRHYSFCAHDSSLYGLFGTPGIARVRTRIPQAVRSIPEGQNLGIWGELWG